MSRKCVCRERYVRVVMQIHPHTNISRCASPVRLHVRHEPGGKSIPARCASRVRCPAGMNLGVRDAHNLCWKVWAVLRGAAGPELLASYERERRDATWATIQASVAKQAS